MFYEGTVPMTPSPLPYAKESADIDCSLSAHQFEVLDAGNEAESSVRQTTAPLLACENFGGNEAESNLRCTTAPSFAGPDVEVPVDINVEVITERSTAPTLESMAPSALCVPEVMDVTDLAERDIEIIAPTFELCAPFVFEISSSRMDVAPVEQMPSWESEQMRRREREGVEVVATEQLEVGDAGSGIILEEPRLTSGSKAETGLQPSSTATELAPCELEEIYMRELEGPDYEAPREIDIDVLEFSAPFVLEPGVDIVAPHELGVESEEMYMESEIVMELAGPDVEVTDDVEAFIAERRTPTMD